MNGVGTFLACMFLLSRLEATSCFDKSSSALSYYFTDIGTCVQKPPAARKACSPSVVSSFDELLHSEKTRFGAYKSNNNRRNENEMSGSLSGLYRPRSALARALYEKQRNDRELQEIDKTEWYRVEKSRLTAELDSKFVQLWPDRDTKEFLAASIDKSAWIWTQIWYLLARLVLKYFWSVTDINGWLGRGSMFVLSEEQLTQLYGAAGAGAAVGAGGSVVDVGAGDGEVSRRWARLFTARYATEISASMRKLLATKGFTVLDADRWWHDERKFDCVCMLNLLDRCSRPRTMLRQARAALAPAGHLLVALVLPCKPYVEVTADHKPEEKMPVSGEHFEEQAASFVEWMRAEMGFELVRWTRAPYLCEGDANQAYYWLDDSVYLFRPAPGSATGPATGNVAADGWS